MVAWTRGFSFIEEVVVVVIYLPLVMSELHRRHIILLMRILYIYHHEWYLICFIFFLRDPHIMLLLKIDFLFHYGDMYLLMLHIVTTMVVFMLLLFDVISLCYIHTSSDVAASCYWCFGQRDHEFHMLLLLTSLLLNWGYIAAYCLIYQWVFLFTAEFFLHGQGVEG